MPLFAFKTHLAEVTAKNCKDFISNGFVIALLVSGLGFVSAVVLKTGQSVPNYLSTHLQCVWCGVLLQASTGARIHFLVHLHARCSRFWWLLVAVKFAFALIQNFFIDYKGNCGAHRKRNLV
jgi:hypothetical protein